MDVSGVVVCFYMNEWKGVDWCVCLEKVWWVGEWGE